MMKGIFKMIDIESVKKELIAPDIRVSFKAIEKVTRKNGTLVEKNRAYVFDARSGNVYVRGREPKITTTEYRVSADNFYAHSYPAKDKPENSQATRGGYYYTYRCSAFQNKEIFWGNPHSSVVEWQYVPKYDVLALVEWVVSMDLTHNSVKITDGIPSQGLYAPPKDTALFQWVVPQDNIISSTIFVVDKNKNISSICNYNWYNMILSYDYDDLNISLAQQRITKNTKNLEVVGGYFGLSYIGRNKYEIPNTPETVATFFRAKPLTVKGGPKQKKADELTSITLTNPTFTDISSKSKFVWRPTIRYCYISRANDEWAVIRWFHNEKESNSLFEAYRLYVNKKDHVYCRNDGNGKFVYFGGKLSAVTFESDMTEMESDDVCKGTKLEYFINIYNEIKDDSTRAKALYMLVSYPEFEMFWKAGLKSICLKYLTSAWGGKWKEHIGTEFGVINDKGKTLYAVLGINKYQFEKYNTNCPPAIIKNIKTVFGADDIRDVDNQSFDIVYNFLTTNDGRNGYYGNFWCYDGVRALENTRKAWSVKTMINMIPSVKSLIGQDVRSNRQTFYYRSLMSALTMYIDFTRMVFDVNGGSRIKPYFKNLNELVDMHDVMIDVVNAQAKEMTRRRDAVYAEKFEARKQTWTKWEYDKNDKWVVIAPTSPLDLAQEGIELHHCVRSFIPDVAEGKTNIVFIREKGKEETPFFTIEILNDGKVRQIHGMCNCNASSEPGLEDFIKEWGKAVKANLKEYNHCLAPG